MFTQGFAETLKNCDIGRSSNAMPDPATECGRAYRSPIALYVLDLKGGVRELKAEISDRWRKFLRAGSSSGKRTEASTAAIMPVHLFGLPRTSANTAYR